VGELCERRDRDRRARLAPAEPPSRVLLRPEEIHRASGEHDVVPPVCGPHETVEEQLATVDLAVTDPDHVGVTAVGTRRFDLAIDVECAEDAERVPGAVGVPPTTFRLDSLSRRYSRKGVRHSDLFRRRVKHDACTLCSWRQPALTPCSSPSSPGVGARPSSTKAAYVRLRRSSRDASIPRRYHHSAADQHSRPETLGCASGPYVRTEREPTAASPRSCPFLQALHPSQRRPRVHSPHSARADRISNHCCSRRRQMCVQQTARCCI